MKNTFNPDYKLCNKCNNSLKEIILEYKSEYGKLEKQNKIWHICKIKGESYLKIDL